MQQLMLIDSIVTFIRFSSFSLLKLLFLDHILFFFAAIYFFVLFIELFINYLLCLILIIVNFFNF